MLTVAIGLRLQRNGDRRLNVGGIATTMPSKQEERYWADQRTIRAALKEAEKFRAEANAMEETLAKAIAEKLVALKDYEELQRVADEMGAEINELQARCREVAKEIRDCCESTGDHIDVVAEYLHWADRLDPTGASAKDAHKE